MTLVYVSGLALVYSLLGLVAGLTGTLFGTVSSNPWAYFAMANLLLLAGLAMLDVFTVTAPRRAVAWAGRIGGGSPAGVFLWARPRAWWPRRAGRRRSPRCSHSSPAPAAPFSDFCTCWSSRSA